MNIVEANLSDKEGRRFFDAYFQISSGANWKYEFLNQHFVD